MLRELRSIEHDGNPSDPTDWHHAPESLWFHARDRVISALLRRGLIANGNGVYELTDAGRAALSAASEPQRCHFGTRWCKKDHANGEPCEFKAGPL